ncbi:hypothetical protein LIA77_00095 [Sarocladium implicatum]|nr:hypothetical protein LIA77_00095 [Sarocladium implicatum]
MIACGILLALFAAIVIHQILRHVVPVPWYCSSREVRSTGHDSQQRTSHVRFVTSGASVSAGSSTIQSSPPADG